MKAHKLLSLAGVMSLAIVLLTLANGVSAANLPANALYMTPTAGADGNIVYIVEEGDTFISICIKMGRNDLACVDEIKNMNGLKSNILSVGQKLIIGQAPTAAAPTTAPTKAAAAPTAAPAAQPTAAGGAPTSKVCVFLFQDANGNATHDADEGVVAGGMLSVINTATGESVQAYKTTAADTAAHCFENLPAGAYTFAMTPPTGYNATTPSSTALTAEAGQQYLLEFGAQPGAKAPTTAGGGGDSDARFRTALFGAAGVVLLLLAAGIAGFLVLRQR